MMATIFFLMFSVSITLTESDYSENWPKHKYTKTGKESHKVASAIVFKPQFTHCASAVLNHMKPIKFDTGMATTQCINQT